jgi:hypothetical protein
MKVLSHDLSASIACVGHFAHHHRLWVDRAVRITSCFFFLKEKSFFSERKIAKNIKVQPLAVGLQ